MTLHAMFMQIKQNVHDIVQMDMAECNWYIGISSHTCEPYTDKLHLTLRFKDLNLGGILDANDLTSGQAQLVKTVTEQFKLRWLDALNTTD